MIGTGNFGPGDPWNAQLDEPAAVAVAIYPLMAVTTAVIAGVGVGVLEQDRRMANIMAELLSAGHLQLPGFV